MARTALIIATFLSVSSYARGAVCKIDAFSVDDTTGVLYATKGGHWASVKPDKVVKTKTALPSVVTSNMKAPLDGMALSKDLKSIIFLKGDDYIGISTDGKDTISVPKAKIDKQFSDQGFKTPFSDMSIGKDGSVWVAAGGHYMGLSEDGKKVLKGKTAFPAALKTQGFDTIDSFAADDKGNTIWTKGAHMIGVNMNTGAVISSMGKQCLPAELRAQGFTSVDGMTYDYSNGNVWVLKGSDYMGVKGGEIIQTKKAFPSTMTFSSVDAFAIQPGTGNTVFVKGDEYMVLKGETVVQKAKKISPKAKENGFTTIQGMAYDKDGKIAIAADGHYMVFKKDSDEVDTKKTAFPKPLTDNGFKAIQGMHLSADGTVYVSQDGYYMGVKGTTIIQPKTLLPSKLSEALCGSGATCITGLSGGTAGTAGTAGSTAGTSTSATALPYSLSLMPLLVLLGLAKL